MTQTRLRIDQILQKFWMCIDWNVLTDTKFTFYIYVCSLNFLTKDEALSLVKLRPTIYFNYTLLDQAIIGVKTK